MFKSKVIDILKTFTNDELKSFRDFLNSPFHNKNKNVIKLFSALKEYYPDFDSDKLSKEKVYNKLFKGKKYNDLVMRILLSNLVTLLEKFFVLKELDKDNKGISGYLISELMDRKLYSIAGHEFKKAASKTITSPNDLVNNMLIAAKKGEFSILTDNQKGNDKNLNDLANNLIAYFLIKLPETYLDLNIHKDLYNIKQDENIIGYFMDMFDFAAYIEFLQENKFEHIELVKLYYNMFLAGKNIDDDNNYYNFKMSLDKQVDNFKHVEKYNLYIRLEGLAIEKIERGRQDFYKELYEIYKKMIKMNILIVPGSKFIPTELFRNIVFTGMTLNKYKWTENFINDFIQFISPDMRDNVYNHSLAHLYFASKEYDRSMEFLNKVRYTLFAYKADVKILMLQLFFETNAVNPAYSALDSFKKFVNNNKNVSGLFKSRFSSFIKYYGKLLKAYENTGGKLVDELDFELRKDENVFKKNWFIEKIDKIK